MKNKNILGVMLDNSRGAVMTVETIKDYAAILAKMGYNALMLYTEETYEIPTEPLFGFMRGRYSIEELKELDAYCESIGVELIPCIQTLAHLEWIFRFPEYKEVRDCDNILLAGEEKTYELIEKMFVSARDSFKTRRIHIGMDEAYMVGRGEYLKRNGFVERFDVLNSHLHKVCEIAKKYDFEPMIWSDMFSRRVYGNNVEFAKNQAALPENISLVHWDYYTEDYNAYTDALDINLAFNRPVLFAGGAWTWRGFAPDNDYTIKTTRAAFKACRDKGIDDVFLTSWGDGGSECSKYAILPSLFYGAEIYRGNDNEESIKAKFKEIMGVDYDDLMLCDKLDATANAGEHSHTFFNPSKFCLYNDPFIGLDDDRCYIGMNEYYAELERTYREKESTNKYSWIFAAYADLCSVLKYKSDLGLRTRAAYKAGDKAALKELAENDYEGAIRNIDKFYESFRYMWFKQNKPFGFEQHERRLGGIKLRLKSCKERILAYIAGEIDAIEELGEISIAEIRKK